MACDTGFPPLIVSSVGGECRIVELPEDECLCVDICGLTSGPAGPAGTAGTGGPPGTAGTAGIDGRKVTRVVVYQATTGTPPGSVPANNTVFTWATGALAAGTGSLNSWAIAAPTVAAGSTLWRTGISIDAAYADSTTTITTGWSAITAVGRSGSDGAAGTAGTAGGTGSTGPIAGSNYKFNDATAVTTPGGGYVGFNNTSFANITKIVIGDTDAAGVNMTTWLNSLASVTGTSKGTLTVFSKYNGLKFALFSITSVTDSGAFFTYEVDELVASNGTISSIFSDEDAISLVFERAGSIGDTGSAGPAGTAGAAGTAGIAGTAGTAGGTGPTGPGYIFESSVAGGWANAAGASNDGAYSLTGPKPLTTQYLGYSGGLNGGSGGYHHQTPIMLKTSSEMNVGTGEGSWGQSRSDGSTGPTPNIIYWGVTMGATGTATLQADTFLQGGSYKKIADLDITAIGTSVAAAPVEGAAWTPGGGGYSVEAFAFITDSQSRQYIATKDVVLDIGSGGAFHVSGATGTIYLDDADGQFGINTTTPGQLLDVVQAADAQGAIRIDNQNATSTSNDARFIAKVAGAGGGDPYLRFMIQGGQSWCLGLANGASDNFRITDANNLDSNVAMEIDASQQVWMPKSLAIGQSAAAHSTAVLECDSTTQVFLPPRMTTTQRDNIVGIVAGGVIYNTSTNVLNFFNGSSWGAV